MQNYFLHAWLLLKRLGILLAIYALCRLLFYLFNASYFSSLSFSEFLSLMSYGLRFDASVIVLSNVLFILLHLLPLPWRDTKAYQILLKTVFIAVNSLALLANCIDFEYFKFTFKRTTADVFNLLATGEDFKMFLPLFAVDYWYIVLIWFLLVMLLLYLYKKAGSPVPHERPSYNVRYFINNTVAMLFLSGISLLVYRGGTQLKPVSILTAGEYTAARHIPLVINTPFSILKTLDQDEIQEINYFPENVLDSIYSPVQKAKPGKFKELNVVVIILESFSKEYAGSFSQMESYTPFLDSLAKHSLVLSNAFANGKKSMEGLPAIVAGIPTLMNEPYITSVYGSNNIHSLASLLKEKGYETSFYHGGTNGTMGFDGFANIAGFNRYYGRKEYNNESDYDGHWGIWDEAYFQYFAKQMNESREPFFSTFFSLSSHHPYQLPKGYETRFKEGPYGIHKSIRYTDHALKRFFDTASKMPWFEQTLFVITADHTGESRHPFYSNSVGGFSIPLLFYHHNSGLKGVNGSVTQQLDIMPSVLDYLNYGESYFSFGTSVFDTSSERFSVAYMNNTYQFIADNYLLQFDGNRSTNLYHITTDSLLQQNLVDTVPEVKKKLEIKLKGIVQCYHSALIRNRMVAEQAKK